MTLVPNPPQRLSGNKLFGFILICCLLLQACNTLKPRPIDPDYGQNKDPQEEANGQTGDPATSVGVDTVAWTDVPENTPHPGFLEPEEPVVEIGMPKERVLKERYEVAIMLPFFTNRYSGVGETVPTASKLALEFYEGVKLALDQLEMQGVNLTIHVKDTQADTLKVKSILQSPEVYNADLIIGPVTRDNLGIVAEFARNNGIPLVSPLNPVSISESENPFLIQVNPSKRTHFIELVKFINQAHANPENVLIISPAGNAGDQRVAYIEEGHQLQSEDANIEPYKQVSFKLEERAELLLEGHLSTLDTTVVIVPSRDEGFVQYVLRELSLLRKSKKFVVYGMEQWQNFERIDYNYFENLNIRVTSSRHLDFREESTLAFKRLFFSEYGMIPVDYSSRGYDVMLYFGKALKDNGVYFPAYLTETDYDVLHSDFNFVERYLPVETSTEEELAVKCFENSHVSILRFEGYEFVRIR
ncbi:MAG: hypothetical protein AAFV80_15655 [Bacteroidota bacterium]